MSSPTIQITPSNGKISVTEGGATGSYTLVLDTVPTSDVIITLDTTNDQVSVDTPTLTFTNANWNTPQTVTVSAVDDTVGEGPHFGVIAHSVTSADAAYNGLNIDPVSIQIADDDLPSGDPTFQPPLTNPFELSDVGSYASPTLADLDADGDLDVLVGAGDGTLYYFENTGTASSAAFASAQTNPFSFSDVGFNPAPTFADLDGDGDLDALVGEYRGSTSHLNYFENTGSASSAAFASAQSDPFGLTNVGAPTPTLADLDDDGDLDALVGDLHGHLNYFENTGSPSSAAFASAQKYLFGLTSVDDSATPIFADLDGDGDLDVLVGERRGELKYFENTGSASSAAFASVQENPFGLSDVGSRSDPTFADLDGDGDLDALIGNKDGNILVFLNAPPPGVTLTPSGGSTRVTEGGATDSYTLVLDSQPTADVVITLDTTNDQVSVDTPTLTFTNANWDKPQTVTVTAVDDSVGEGPHFGVIAHSVSSTDTAYDGLTIDRVSIQIADDDLPSGDPTFQPPLTNPFGLSAVKNLATPTFADLDADGDLDALVGEYDGTLNYFENTGNASSAAFASAQTDPFGLSDVGSSARPTLADLDGDGDLDALIGNYDGHNLYFENTGSTSSAAFASAQTDPFGLSDVGSRASPTLADLDGDGDLDALIGNNYGHSLYFENTGNASSAAFANAQTDPFGLSDVGSYATPTLADLDGDGDLDALIGNKDGNSLYFENTGSTSSAAFATSAQTDPFELSYAGHVATPTLADLDGDGDLDALIGEFSGNTFYFENGPSNSAPSITSATYDSSTNVLSVIAADITSGDTIDVSKLTLTGEGGQTYTLTSDNVTASSDTAFSV
ncbi:FG-GAP repeat protein, partial [Thiorhodococcus drewsii AZ1]